MLNKRICLGILTILWMCFIFIMSSDSGEKSDHKSSEIVNYIVSKYDQITNASMERINYHQSVEFKQKANYVFRKICHFGEYFILSILLINWIIALNKCSKLFSGIWAIAISFIYALFDEYHQTFINGRNGNLIDSLIDTTGAILGICIVMIISYFVNKYKDKREKLLKN